MRLVRPAARGTAAGAGRGKRAPGNKKLAEVARGSTLNLVGVAVAAATTLALTVLVTRLFSGPVAGTFFSATSLFLIIESVASLGAFSGVVYFIARLRLLGEEGRINAILRAAIIPVVIVSLTGTALLLLFAEPLARVLLGGHLGHGGATPAAVATALRALALALPFAALLDTLLGATRGYRDMRPTVVIFQLGRSVAQLAAVAIAVAAGSAALLAPLWAVPYIPAHRRGLAVAALDPAAPGVQAVLAGRPAGTRRPAGAGDPGAGGRHQAAAGRDRHG